MFKELLSGVQEKYKKMQEEETKYQELLGKVFTLPKFYSFTPSERKDLTISYRLLMDLCPDLNERDAILIRGLIPIDEIVLSCLYAVECKSAVKFYFVATTKYLWLVNSTGFLKYRYQDFSIEVIKNGLMSKVLWMGNMLFTVNGLNDAVLYFVKLLQDHAYLEELIHQKLALFHGSIPYVFYLNDIGSGISIGTNQEIIFHTKDFHYRYLIHEIKNYELLLDDMVVREKKSNRRARLTANKNSCYEMVLRITTVDRVLLIPILEKTAFVSLYSSTNAIFIENRAFADQIIHLLDDLDEKMLNGEL